MTRYPAFYVLVFFISGILIGQRILISDFVAFCLTGLLFVALTILLFRRHTTACLVVSAVVLIILGIFRHNLVSANFPTNHISYLTDLGRPMTLYGRLVREPDVRPDKTYLTVASDSVRVNDLIVPTSGRTLVRISRLDDRFNFGDRIGAHGYLSTPIGKRNFHGFDYRRYLGLKQIHSFMSIRKPEAVWTIRNASDPGFLPSVVIPLRNYILAVFERHLSGDARHLVAGFLIGETRFIPNEVYEQFRNTGTLHLLAVSGSNVALVILTVMLFLRIMSIPKRLSHLLCIGVVILFCNLSFNQPSVVRASIMIGIVLLGRILFRRSNLLNTIAVAAIVILAYDPLMLFDVGFQLSFAAAFSLIYFLSGIYRRTELVTGVFSMLKEQFWMILASSVVVQIVISPILAYYFGRIPLITFLSNLVVIPLSSIAVVLSICLIAASPMPYLSGLIAWLTQSALDLSLWTVRWFSSMPIVRLDLSAPEPIHFVMYYVVIFVLYAVVRRTIKARYFLMVLLVWGNVLIWQHVTAGRSDSAELTCLDLGNQTAIHLKLPGGRNIMLTSARESGYNQVERILVPYAVGEGIGGFDALKRVSSAPDSVTPPDYLLKYLDVNKEPTTVLVDSVFPRSTSGSVVLEEGMGGVFKLRADLNGWRILWFCSWEHMEDPPQSDSSCGTVLILPFPGDGESLRFKQIERISPEIVILCTYPDPWDRSDIGLMIRELELLGCEVFDTQRFGSIRFRFNEKGLDLESALGQRRRCFISAQ